ncbi:cupin domain-containing protein [Glutamicibacter mishrai]|uniref:cupin domain-containing protein n=1 Tax=Glutamicibacter mishrai TaxID=1775880 RepID=UPI0020CF5AFE|nr:cupin domain-containing protein [Glutamicibacter mishrai]UTT38997.1 cupin domain-containing protein [Glutamicibacter mishrai]
MTGLSSQPTSDELLELPITHHPINTAQRIEGHVPATTGFQQLSTLGEAEIGIWEMSPGAMQDIEADEYFAVLRGRGQLQILAEDGTVAHDITLAAGTSLRLTSGMRTRWTVAETLRKIYFTL